jgi:hypothetical protein
MDILKTYENIKVKTTIVNKGFKKLQNNPKTESLYFPLMSLFTSSTNKNLYLVKLEINRLSNIEIPLVVYLKW